MKRQQLKGDVEWYIKGKRPFAYSTLATRDLIKTLCEMYTDLRDVYKNINYDEDAKKIVKRYIDAGVFSLQVF